MLGEGECLATAFLGSDDKVDLHRGIGFEGFVLQRLGGGGLVEKFQQHGVAHTEPDGGEIGGAVAQIGEQAVVAAAARDRAEIPLKRKGLEDHACIVGETAHHPGIGAHVVAQTTGLQVGQKRGEGGDLGLLNELPQGLEPDAELVEQLRRFLGRHLLHPVDDGQKLGGTILLHPVPGHEVMPRGAVAQAYCEIPRPQTEGAEQIDQESNHLGVCGSGGVADEVAVELQELAQAPALLALVAETGADIEPAQGLGILPVACRHHAGQSRRHLGAQRHGTLTLVGELVELSQDLAAAVLFAVKFGGFQRRPVEFDKAVTPRRPAPAADQIVAPGELLGKEVAEAGKRFHGRCAAVSGKGEA